MAAPKNKVAPKKVAPKKATATTRKRPQLDKMSVGKKGGKVAFYDQKRGHKMIDGSEREVGLQNATLANAGGSKMYPYSSRYKSQFELKGQGKRRGGK